MRWDARNVGAVRVRERFAWIPIKTDDGFIVWLERYLSFERYDTYASSEVDGVVEAGPAWLPYWTLSL